MQRVKRALRRALAAVLYRSGLLWLYAGWRLRRKAVVLMYHRVLPAGADTYSHDGIIVTPATFDLHMAFLARHFRVLTPSQFRRELSDSAFGRRACLVTFDDGWRDNLQHALPILRRHGVPAIVFVATGFIGSRDTFWQERLLRLLCLAARQDGLDPGLFREAGLDGVARGDAAKVRQRAREFVTGLKLRDRSVAHELIERLRTALSSLPESGNLGEDTFMDWAEVNALREGGLITIGSHAHSHTRLTTLGYQGARREFETSRQALAGQGITEVIACAYPNGDVNDPVEAAATDAGFALGFATKGGLVAHRSEAMHLRRINIHEADCRSGAELLYRMLGLP